MQNMEVMDVILLLLLDLVQLYKVLPLRAAARCTHERGGIGVWTVAETRAVHEYQQEAKWPNCIRIVS